jgi:hypothetical protein
VRTFNTPLTPALDAAVEAVLTLECARGAHREKAAVALAEFPNEIGLIH